MLCRPQRSVIHTKTATSAIIPSACPRLASQMPGHQALVAVEGLGHLDHHRPLPGRGEHRLGVGDHPHRPPRTTRRKQGFLGPHGTGGGGTSA